MSDISASENKQFINMADGFIDLANKQCEGNQNALVNASFLYGAARFSAFMTASGAKSKESYTNEMDNAVEYYTQEFSKMLKEHMQQYVTVFKEECEIIVS